MLKLWEETRKKKECSHIVVILKGQFKGETEERWHMFTLVDITESGTVVRKWVGKWLKVLVEQYGRSEV